MRSLRYPGWALLLAAFASAAAEIIVPSAPGTRDFFVSAHELWYSGWPGSLIKLQIRLERIEPMLWDPILTGVLALPAWLLLGLPGIVLTWMSRPRGFADRRERAEVRKYEEALLLYDDLAREAREQGMDKDGDDMLPDHSGHDALDALELDDDADDDIYSMERAEEMRLEIAKRRGAQGPGPGEREDGGA
ncbi:MAG: hypothetical protein VW338_12035 [Rhodospirillaceae bacterium]|jgi:hypothetical protein